MTFIPPIALLPKLNQSVIFDSNLLYQVKVTHCACFSIATWMQRDDTDTIAAICRKIAGTYHGIDNIPMHWLDKLHDHTHHRSRSTVFVANQQPAHNQTE